MALDVGDLVARLRVDGVQDFDRDAQRAENRFRALGRQAEQSGTQSQNAFRDTADQAQRSTRAVDNAAKAQDRAAKAADAAAKAAGNTRVAEQRLAEIRERNGRSSQILAAEERLAEARRQQTRATRNAATANQELQQELRQTERASQQAATEATNAFRDMGQQVSNSSSGIGNAFRQTLGDMGSTARDAGLSGGGSFLAGFGGRIASLGGKAGPIGAALLASVGLGVMIGKTLADQVMAGFELQAQRGMAQAKFGFTDAQMRTVGKAAGDAYSNAWGESVSENMDAAGAAVQAGLVGAGASADELQPIIEKLQIVSGIMGTEIPETARAAGQMVKTGLAQNSTQAFDLLTAAQQRGLNMSDDLLDTITEYGTQWRKLGIDGATAMGTISQMVKGGARDTDIAADALKEFSLRVVDGSDSTKDAFKSLSINAEEATQEFSKGGPAARAMADKVITALQNIDDGNERNRIGLELFGTQWEDLGGAIDRMSLSKAAGELGNVGGAADRAGTQMSGAASSIEGAKRTIEVAADQMKLKLAEAFAPMATDLGAWITKNKDAITAFFLGAADVTLGFIQALLQVAAAGGDMDAALLRAGASVLDNFVLPMLTGMKEIGNAMSYLPGSAGEMGDKLKEGADKAHDALGGTRDTMRSAAEGANTLADGYRSLSDRLGGVRDGLQETRDRALTSQAGMDALRDSVLAVPSAKSVIVSDNSPQAIQGMKDLGLTVTTLPNGTVRVDADTAAAQTKLNELTGTKSVTLTVDMILANAQDPVDQAVMKAFHQAQGHADGGQVHGPGGPRSDSIPTLLSNREWVQQVAAVDYYGPTVMDDMNHMRIPREAFLRRAGGGPVGYGMPADGSGAFPDWVTALGAQYGVKPSTYAGHQTTNRTEAGYAPNPQGLNRGIDWGGSVPAMQAFAEAMFQRAASDPAIEQIIWQNPTTGQKIGWHGRSPDTDGSYYASDYPAHQNHVHLRVSSQIGATSTAGTPGQRTIPLVRNPDGTWTSSDPAWAALIKRESGGRADAVQGIQDANSGGNEASGLFQIAKGTWASNGGSEFAATAGQATPDQQAIVAARIFDKSGGSPWGAGMPGREDEAALRAGITTSGGTDAASSSTPSGPVQNVYVTGGHLDGAPSSSSSTSSTPSTKPAATTTPKPTGPLPLIAMAKGGFGPDSATMLDDAKAWVTLAGEAGREAFIPINNSKRSKSLWMQTGRELGMLRAYAQGGFGGYSDDTRDYMAPTSLGDYVALGVGGAFAVGSMLEPYFGMAGSKQITLGDLSPQMNTGANSFDGGLTQAVGQWADAVTKQVAELTKAVREQGKSIQLVREVAPQRNSPFDGVGPTFTARGV